MSTSNRTRRQTEGDRINEPRAQDENGDYEDENEYWSEWLAPGWDQDRHCWSSKSTSSKGNIKYHYYDEEQNAASERISEGSHGDNYIMSTQEYETQTERQYSSAAGATNHESIPRDNRGSSSSSRHYSSNYARYYISQTSGQSSRETEPPQASYTPSKISGKAPEQIIPSDHVECACGTKEGLCGIIFWPEEPLPKDGKITEQKKSLSKKSGSSGNKHTSSKPKGNTPHSKGTAGGCGPLWGPGITPEPPPQKPDPDASSEEKNEYRKRQAEWNAAYDVWKDISCPCGWGYFNLEGIWIDGAMVRKRLEPSNPLWAENSGRSPQNIREMKGERGNLFERGQIGGHGHPESRINVRFD